MYNARNNNVFPQVIIHINDNHFQLFYSFADNILNCNSTTAFVGNELNRPVNGQLTSLCVH